MRLDTVSAVLALRANSSRGGAGGAAAATLEVVGRDVARGTSQAPSTPTLSIVGPRIPTALSVGLVGAYVGSIGPDSFHAPWSLRRFSKRRAAMKITTHGKSTGRIIQESLIKVEMTSVRSTA
jgi:hypothetical protein